MTPWRTTTGIERSESFVRSSSFDSNVRAKRKSSSSVSARKPSASAIVKIACAYASMRSDDAAWLGDTAQLLPTELM